jgi:hypothetical protein
MILKRARQGSKRVAVEMELEKEEYDGRSETGAFSALNTGLVLPRQSMLMYVR